MKLKIVYLIIIVLGGVLALASCTSAEENEVNTSSTEKFETKYNTLDNAYLLNNPVLFTYHTDTTLTIESFDNFTTLADLKVKLGVEAIRENNGNYYTVYSLKDNKLAYVVFWYSLYTGVDFYIDNILVYPTDDVESELPFLLEKDLPDRILN